MFGGCYLLQTAGVLMKLIVIIEIRGRRYMFETSSSNKQMVID